MQSSKAAEATADMLLDLLNRSSVTNSTNFTLQDEWESMDFLLNDFKASLTRHTVPRVIVLICIYVPIFLTAFIGNILVLVVVACNKHMRSVTNYFLVNLAVADLLVTIVCIPMTIAESVYRVWVYGEFLCKVTPYLQGIAVAASVLSLTALSLDRFLAIRHPMKFRRLWTKTYAKRLVILIWILSALIMIPLILVRKTYVISDLIPSEHFTFCHEKWSSSSARQTFDVFLLCFMCIVPVSIIVTTYSMMGRSLWKSSRTLQRQDSNVSMCKRMTSGRRKVARMLIVVAVLFGISWLPYYVITTYLVFHPEDTMFLSALPFALLLAHSNSAHNPILYCFMNVTFRKCVYKILQCLSLNRFKYSKDLVVQYSNITGSIRTSLRHKKFSHNKKKQRGNHTANPVNSTCSVKSVKFDTTEPNGLAESSANISRSSSDVDMPQGHSTFPPKALFLDLHSRREAEPTWDNIELKDLTRREILNKHVYIPSTINEETRSPSSDVHVSLKQSSESPESPESPEEWCHVHSPLMTSEGRRGPSTEIEREIKDLLVKELSQVKKTGAL